MKVSADIMPDAVEKLAKAFLGFAIWHDVASKTYGGGKKAEFKRDQAYSESLGLFACKNANEILSKYGFANIKAESFAEVKLSDKAKFVRDMIKLGMNESDAIAGWETAEAKRLEREQSTKAEEKVVS